ncbi:MAG: YgjV family protein [Chitinophagaceae bacterium]|nr:YgjV family protein [Chitinophagaceae bacterium]MCW5904792.1 YgjV family protein [Chitinophagaceae bacterium]
MINSIIGYSASLFLGISLLVSNNFKFRWWNTIGCLTFVIYGFLINAYPVSLANGVLLIINTYQLIRLYQSKEKFELLSIPKDSALVEKFINFYDNDIKKFFPEANTTIQSNTFALVVLRNMVIANMVIANVKSNGEAEVEIDYTIPQYRDYKSGQFIFEKEKQHLIKNGITTLTYHKNIHPAHQKFLQKMGFVQTNDNNCFKKELV